MITLMTREDYVTEAAPFAGGPAMAGAELDVYCPEHGGYRDECGCKAPSYPGQYVRVDARFVAFPAPIGPAERPDGWCQTCGNPVNARDVCACWCRVADALQRYLAADFDGAAADAHRMWDQMELADKAAVWSAAFAGDHDGVETYPLPPAMAALAAADAAAHPHDEDCPRCGRRQWGGPDPYGLCLACGFRTEDL